MKGNPHCGTCGGRGVTTSSAYSFTEDRWVFFEKECPDCVMVEALRRVKAERANG